MYCHTLETYEVTHHPRLPYPILPDLPLPHASRHDADPNVRDNLGRRAGDSLCGLVVERVAAGGGATSRESVVFSETRAILDAARAEHAAKAQSTSGSGGASASVASNACRGCLCVVDEAQRGLYSFVTSVFYCTIML